MRNEVVEELSSHRISENGAELNASFQKDSRNRGVGGEKSRR